jgi:cation diffusion facilitator CzcD-associated flavoprotein CzcO/acetyl esterase/lipase
MRRNEGVPNMTQGQNTPQADVDVVVVGAGMAGLYLIHRLRAMDLSVRVIETGHDVGGTWYWNRYPGARCDVQSVDYSYSFDPELDAEWTWSEKYAAQPEILRYLGHVADRFDLRRSITFSTRVERAQWDDASSLWSVHTSTGEMIHARYYVMATGCLSIPKELDIAGADRFAGETYFTSRWPHEGVDLTGKRVAVIGTGSSAIQSIPIMAAQAAELTVFQRTPNFSIPAHNGPTPKAKWEAVNRDRREYRHAARRSGAGVTVEISEVSALMVSDQERLARYERAWVEGGIMEFLGTYNDHLANPQANELLAEFVRNKVRAIVGDPATAEILAPKGFPIGTKRLCVDSGYYETFNRPNVKIVDLNAEPIVSVTETGVALTTRSIEADVIVFATGFDAMTGALVSVDITGRQGTTLRDAWVAGPTTYLGLMAADFPNLFFVTGPGSPSVLSNMAVSIEQHVEWITDCIGSLRADDFTTIEPTSTAVDAWVQHVNDFASLTLMPQANSWYMGANVPGKARVFLPYPGGVDRYRIACEEVVARDYLGFDRGGATNQRFVDGVIRPVQPDVAIMLELIAGFGLPPLETMSPTDVRAFVKASAAARAPGPEVGETIDATLPGAVGDLTYRLHRPASPGPHALIVYFHGGGWLFGDATSDDPFCRDLCVRTNAIVVSVDYRHAPETPFPGAVDDALAATRWVAEHAEELGGTSGAVAVAGWSAGGNLAAVVAQQAPSMGLSLIGQILVCPLTDGSVVHPSHVENADGYALTASVMRWFWDNYAASADRSDPRLSPLVAPSLDGVAPAVIVTAQFDPLRDEGDAYAAALSKAGVPVVHVQARGHIHTSVLAVDMLPSGAAIRDQLGDAVRAILARESVSA